MSEPFVGVQLGAHSVFDEGADHALDLLQETAGINAVLVYSHTYQGFAKERAVTALAPDHGVPVRDPASRNLPRVWVTPHAEYYAGTFLGHPRTPGEVEYADRDVLAELVEPTQRRGIKLYARILEGFGPKLAALVPNWPKALDVDVYGSIGQRPCWNNPAYRNWWLSTVEDLFKSYPLDGLQFGAERVGPLPGVLFRAIVPTCFCQHCQDRNRARGIDIDRARAGYRQLYELMSGLWDGEPPPLDGVLVTVLRILLRHPEVLSWEYQWRRAKEEVDALVYGAIKAIKPAAQVGRHIDHQGSTWDPIYRAEMSYDEIANYCDFLKPIVYHDIAGPRIRWWLVDRLHKGLLGEFSQESILELFYNVMGYDKRAEPSLGELDSRGLSPDYVYRETRRTVEGVRGKVPVYAGLGFDVPWARDGAWEGFSSDPETVYQATLKAFDAGASGIVISREYDEMRVHNLRAVGRAVRDASPIGR